MTDLNEKNLGEEELIALEAFKQRFNPTGLAQTWPAQETWVDGYAQCLRDHPAKCLEGDPRK